MTCKLCNDQIGLPAEWNAHARLERPGTARTAGYVATANQKLYACTACHTVLRRGKNTGWVTATRAVVGAEVAPIPTATGA